MLIETLSTFPHMYDSVMGESMMKRAQEKGILEFRAHDLRDWTHDRHRTTDDDPYGGGAGLVMKCEPIFEAVEAILGKEFVEAKLASAMGEPGGISGGAHQASSAANAISPVGCRAERGLSERLSTTRKPAPEESQADSREPQFAHVQADGTLPHFVPERRLRLFNSLKALGTPAAPTVTTRLWGQITIDTELCRSCRMCTVFCPTGALTRFDAANDAFGVEHRSALCMQCRLCETICPEQAITVAEEVSADEFLSGKKFRFTMQPIGWNPGAEDSIASRMARFIKVDNLQEPQAKVKSFDTAARREYAQAREARRREIREQHSS